MELFLWQPGHNASFKKSASKSRLETIEEDGTEPEEKTTESETEAKDDEDDDIDDNTFVRCFEEWTTKDILKGISLYFNPGSIIGIMGPSGSGKTTFLDILTGRRTGKFSVRKRNRQ